MIKFVVVALTLASAGSTPALRALECLRVRVAFGTPEPDAQDCRARIMEAHGLGSERLHGQAGAYVEPCGELARRWPTSALAGHYRAALAAAHLGTFDYPAALAELVEAKRVLNRIGDWDGAAVVSSNLSNLYLAIQALPESQLEAEAAIRAQTHVRDHTIRDRMLLQKARLLSRRRLAEDSEELFAGVIATAEQRGNDRLAAEAWDMLGFERLYRGDAELAERAMLRAIRLRWTIGDPGLGHSRRKMALVRLALRDPASAERFSQASVQAFGQAPPVPDWNFLSIRGRVLGGMDEHERALVDLRTAAAMIAKFRLDQIPSSLRSSSAQTIRPLYDDIVASGTRLYRQTRDPRLLAETLAAAAASQAFGLQAARRPAPKDSAGLDRLRHAYGSGGELDSHRLALVEHDVASGPGGRAELLWSNLGRSLPEWRDAIAPDEAVLVAHVARDQSWLWAFTRDSLQAIDLPGRATLESAVDKLVDELRGGREPANAADLHDLLLSRLDAPVLAKPRWLVVADGPLLRLPMAVLRNGNGYLVERHSIRQLPGLWMLGARRGEFWNGTPVAIADPIYNRADRRLGSARFFGEEMPQLPSTAAEIDRCARALGGAQNFTGARATVEQLEAALKDRPSVLHFSVHGVPAPDNPAETLLLLSPSPGAPGYLSAEWIASHQARPRLVTMATCRSGSGQVRSGDGLLGLTRAWLLSGAHAVLASLWPIPDDSGGLVEDFYRHWRGLPPDKQDEALRRAQVDAIRSASWRSEPAYWAAYFVVGDHARIR